MRKFSVLVTSIALIFSGLSLAPASAVGSKVTLTYHYEGATSGDELASADFTEGDSPLQLPYPVKTGFVFEGWYPDQTFDPIALIGIGGATYSPTVDSDAYANWITCSDFATELSDATSSSTWGSNPVSATGGQTLTVMIQDVAGNPVGGIASCLSLDAGDPIQAVTFVETTVGSGNYEAQVNFDVFTDGFPVTVDPIAVVFPDGTLNSTFSLVTPALRIDAGNLDIDSQDIQMIGIKNTVASSEVTVTNIGDVPETFLSDPTITSSDTAITEAISSATGDGTNSVYTVSNALDFVPGQLVTITGFTNTAFNKDRAQVVTTFGNTFTLEGAAIGGESPSSASAESTSVFIDSSATTTPCATELTLLPTESCSVIVQWGISTQAALTKETIGTLNLETDNATQNIEVFGKASEGRKVVTTISGTSALPSAVDPRTEWCATGVGMTIGGTATCSSPDSWQPAHTAYGVDPQSIYYKILSRIYPGDHPYGSIIGTSHWINCGQYTDSACGLQKTNIYRVSFTLPKGWYDPAYTFTVQGDNFVDTWINPQITESGEPVLTPSGPEYFVPGGRIQEDLSPQTACSANYAAFPNNKSAPPSPLEPGNMYVAGVSCIPSSAHLVAGVNYIYVRLTDGGGLAGINYRLDLGYRETELCTVGCGGDDPAPPPAPKEALIPQFGTPESLPSQGYKVQILNYVSNGAYTWKTKVSDGTATISPTGLLTVTRDLPVTVSTSQTKYPNGSAIQTAPIRPLLPVVLNPAVSPTTSYYSQNVSGSYSANVSIAVNSPANVDHVYTEGSFHYSVKADGGAAVTKAVSNIDGTSVTYTVTGNNTENKILAGELPGDAGQFVTVVGLNDSNASLSVSNWQVTSVTEIAPAGGMTSYEFVASVPQLDSAALSPSQFTASVSPGKTVEKRTGGLAQSANCAFIEGSSSTTLENIHLTGSAKMTLLPVCTLSVTHDADGTHDSSSGETVFTFVKERPSRVYTGTVSMLVNSRAANLNSTWDLVTACTATGKYSYTFTGGSLSSPLVTPATDVPLQSVPVSLPVGAYEVTPNYSGDHNCAATQTDPNATSGFVVYDSSNSAYGEGSYNVYGKAYFEFESHKSKTGIQSGNIVWTWNNSWRYKGKLTAFGKKTSGVIGNLPTQQSCSAINPCGSLSGAGTLEYFDGVAWVSVGSAINVNVSVAAKKVTKANAIPGHIGITFGYKALAGQPALPSNALFPMIRRNSHDYGTISLK